MRRRYEDSFPYCSRAAPWSANERVYILGHSPWVRLLFHPNRDVHEHAWFMVDLDAKYNRRYRPPAWMLWKMPVLPYTMVFRAAEAPRTRDRVAGWVLALIAFCFAITRS